MIVVVSDLKDSSQVIDAVMTNEPLVVATLDAYHADVEQACAQRGGEFVKFMGDGAIAFFQDDQGTDALDYARQLIRLGRRFAGMVAGTNYIIPTGTRVGIATGSVIRTARDVIGDVINLAARLETAAETDTIVLDHETAKSLGSLNADPVTVEAKGQRHPIRAYRTR